MSETLTFVSKSRHIFVTSRLVQLLTQIVHLIQRAVTLLPVALTAHAQLAVICSISDSVSFSDKELDIAAMKIRIMKRFYKFIHLNNLN